MEALAAFARTVDSHRGLADFALVYVAEAHPTDGWDVGSKYRLRAHRSADERLAAARILRRDAAAAGVAESDVKLLVDGLDDEVAAAFGALPERLAIVQHGRLVWLGGCGPMDYSVPALTAELARICNDGDVVPPASNMPKASC